jgi:hypothetical protein
MQPLLELWSNWSKTRNDIRVQVGSEFDPNYEKPDVEPDPYQPSKDTSFTYKKLLGWIWPEQLHPSMIPLYTAYSNDRKDTQTKPELKGLSFDSMYSDKMVIGYMYPHPLPEGVKQDALSPLYFRWSQSQNHSRTQVGNEEWGDYDDGQSVLLGYIVTTLFVVQSFDFTVKDWQALVGLETAAHRGQQILDNAQGEDVKLACSFVHPHTIKCSFKDFMQNYPGTHVQGIKISLPIADRTGHGVAIEHTVFLHHEEETRWDGHFEQSFDVADKQKLLEKLTVFEAKLKLPYTAALTKVSLQPDYTENTYGITKTNTDPVSLDGTCEVVHTNRVEVTTDDVKPTDNPEDSQAWSRSSKDHKPSLTPQAGHVNFMTNAKETVVTQPVGTHNWVAPALIETRSSKT